MRVLLLIAAVVVLLYLYSAHRSIQHYLRRHGGFWVVTFHVLTGRYADGKQRNNRGWFRSATNAMPANRWYRQYELTWLGRIGIVPRALVMSGGLLAVIVTGYGLLAARGPTVAVLCYLTGGVLIAVAARGVHLYRTRHHRRHLVKPLADALAKELGQDASVIARSLHVSPRHELAGYGRKVAHLQLPSTFPGDNRSRERVSQIVAAHLPIEAPEPAWRLNRLNVFSAAAPPPGVVRLPEYADAMDELHAGKYFVGIGGSSIGAFFHEPMIDEPHVAFNARTQAGKTNCVSCLIAQALRRGEEVWAVDPKEVSLEHFLGVPGFRLANDSLNLDAMAQLILDFHAAYIATKRSRQYNVHRWLVLEEINMLNLMLEIWWRRTGDGKRKNNPAVMALEDILNGGAQFNHRVFVTGQELTQNAMWNLRHRFGTVFMARYDDNVWRYICPGTPPPAQPTHPGRMYVVRNGIAALVQVPIAHPGGGPRNRAVNNELWYRYALGDRVPAAAPSAPRPPHARPQPRPAVEAPVSPRELASEPAVLIGLAEASAYLGMTYNAFKLARKKLPGGKVPGEFTTVWRGREKPAFHRDTLDLLGWGSGRGVGNRGRRNADYSGAGAR